MKRYKAYKAIKRPKFLTRTIHTTDVPEVDIDKAYENNWLMKLEKRETKRFRHFRHQQAQT